MHKVKNINKNRFVKQSKRCIIKSLANKNRLLLNLKILLLIRTQRKGKGQ